LATKQYILYIFFSENFCFLGVWAKWEKREETGKKGKTFLFEFLNWSRRRRKK